MITISLCMIVKNEEKVLKRCLDSLSGLCDETIIVDTGSVDSTKEIAHRYTTSDKIYDFEWTGDFAAARNFAFGKCRCDYIYCVDADEVLDEENRRRFLTLKAALESCPEIEVIQMKYKNQLQFSTIYNYDEELRPKMYKRLRTFTWEYPIHEAVRLEPVVFDSDIVIIHMPEGQHTGRDLEAFRRIVKDTISGTVRDVADLVKDDSHVCEAIRRRLRLSMDKKQHNLYAKELFVSGSDMDFARALEFFELTAEDTERSQDESLEAFCVCARAFRLAAQAGNDKLLEEISSQKDMKITRQDAYTGFFKYATKALLSGGCSEICHELGDFYKNEKDDKEASMWYYNAANETDCILSVKYRTEGEI